MAETETKKGPVFAETYGGIWGGLLPLITMIAGMVALSLLGMRSTKNFWCAGLLATVAGFFVYKDKQQFQAALIDGATDKIFGFLILCALVAGVLSRILSASHLVPGMLWAASSINLHPGLMPLTCFILGAILSTATGSAASSVSTLTPVMVPLAAMMGCNINLICGAVISGAAFGDNLAPISDTTIASSLTQEVSVIRVVKSRLKYSLAGGAAAAAAFLGTGFLSLDTAASQTLSVDATYATSLVFLVIPVLIIVLMLNNAGFFTALIISELVGLVMLFGFGYMDFHTLVAKDGLIASAFDRMLPSVVFILFIFIMVSLIRNAGVLNAMLNLMRRYAKSDRTAEIASGAMVSVMSVAVSSGTSAITFCGPIIRGLLRPFKIDRARAANFLDGLGCGVGYLVPTNAGNLVLASLAVASGGVAEGYNAVEFVGYNFYSMALVVVFWVAILTGWGRRHETDEELIADGVDPGAGC